MKDWYEAEYKDDCFADKIACYGDGKYYRVPLPSPPPLSAMRNFGKKSSRQFFERDEIPLNFRNLSLRDKNSIMERLYHKREHGEWQLVNGKAVYITGDAWVFFNLWNLEKGGLPTFRMEAVEFFQFWKFIENDPLCLGMLEFKPRRLGETEKINCLLWNFAARYRGATCGIISKTGDDSKAAYLRLVYGHRKMPYMFRPKNTGYDNPQNGLLFEYAPKRQTTTHMADSDWGAEHIIPAIGSRVIYRPTVQGAFDSLAVHRLYGDEFFKISPRKMNIRKQYGVMKQCATENVGTKIVGKIILASTVESTEENKDSAADHSESLKIAGEMWRDSNPEIRTESGRTVTGLYRIVRNFECGADVDEYGFHKVEEVRRERRAQIKALEEAGDLAGLINFKRMYPLDEHDSLMPSTSNCPLHPELVSRRIRQIRHNQWWNDSEYDDRGHEVKPKAIRGNFEWEGGVFGDTVRWCPDENGRWVVSQHPEIPNQKIWRDGRWLPGLNHEFCIGADPIGTFTNSRWRSNGAIAVRRKFDPGKEVCEFDKYGNTQTPWLMKTAQFVCTYSYRADNPRVYFEDCLLTAIYYGCLVHIEEGSSQYVEGLFRDEGFIQYLQSRPKELATTITNRIQKGTKASASIVSRYVSMLKQDIYQYWHNYHHTDLLEDMLNFTVENRTKHDLTVAAAFALLSELDSRYKPVEVKEEQTSMWWKEYEGVSELEYYAPN